MKKFAIAVAAVALLGIQAEASSFQGAYAGLKGGIQTVTAKFKARDNALGNETGHPGGHGGLFAGYGHMFHDMYVALQADASIGGYQNSVITPSGGFKTKADCVYGVAGLVGYQPIANVVTYLKLGAHFASWKITRASESLKKSKTLTGLGTGLGMRVLIAKNVFFDMAYDFTFFRNMILTGSRQDTAKPRLQTFTVGLAYKF